jgi:hypothetical protein
LEGGRHTGQYGEVEKMGGRRRGELEEKISLGKSRLEITFEDSIQSFSLPFLSK